MRSGYYNYYRVAPPAAAVMGTSLAGRLLGTEAQGLAIDFTDLSMVIRDTGTPANNFAGNPNNKLTYSSPSTKWILGANGLYSSGSTLRTSYNASGTALGVLIEEARTNLMLRSQELDNASWVKVTTSVTANAATSPDGTVTADLLESTVNGTFCYMYQGVTLNISTTYTVSFFAKYSTCRWLACLGETSNNAFVYFDVQNGVVGTAQLGSSGTITSVGNGWYYCTATFPKSTATASEQIGFMVATADNGVTATIGLGSYIWQVQIEAGAFATSPIVTAGSTVTRAADNISLATSLFPSLGADGTMFVAGQTLAGNAATSYALELFTDGSNFSAIRNDSGATAQAIVFTGGASVAAPAVGNWPTATQKKVALRVKTNDTNICSGGTLGTNDTTCAMPTYTTMFVGSNNGVGNFNGYLSQIMTLPRAQLDAELQALTT